MLRTLPTYKTSPLVRTRDLDALKTCHTVVDVGGEYDVGTNRFDHHQREFTTTFPGRSTKLSSAGLVFMHLGKSIIAQQTGLGEESDECARIYEKMYDDFIEAFDANDNGISAYDTTRLQDMGVTKRFNDRGFSIASVVNRFNYAKNDVGAASDTEKTKEQQQAEEDARFLKASAFVGTQFDAELSDTFGSWLPARRIVAEAFAARSRFDEKGRILVLPYRKEGLPYHDHLYNLETEEGKDANQVLYTLFAENGQPDSKWRIRAVSSSAEGFELRKPLPEKWRGVRDDQLDQVTGIPGCVFVHASGFIGGNKTFDGALQMAKTALNTDQGT